MGVTTPHFLPGITSWRKEAGAFEIPLPGKPSDINEHFANRQIKKQTLKLKFWIPQTTSNEITKPSCRKPCLGVDGTIKQREGTLIVGFSKMIDGLNSLRGFLEENKVSDDEIYFRTFVPATFSLIFVIYKTKSEAERWAKKRSTPESGTEVEVVDVSHEKDEQTVSPETSYSDIEWEEVRSGDEMQVENPDTSVHPGDGTDDEIQYVNPDTITWTLDPNLNIKDESDVCREVELGFKLKIQFQLTSTSLPDNTTLNLRIDGFEKEFIVNVSHISDGTFSIETTSPLKVFDSSKTKECRNFYRNLKSRLLELAVGKQQIFAARFKALEGELWPYQVSGADLREQLVYEAFRDYVDVFTRISYHRGNVLLSACQDSKLTVDKMRNTFAVTRDFLNYDDKERNKKEKAIIEPFIDSFQNALDLYAKVINQASS